MTIIHNLESRHSDLTKHHEAEMQKNAQKVKKIEGVTYIDYEYENTHSVVQYDNFKAQCLNVEMLSVEAGVC